RLACGTWTSSGRPPARPSPEEAVPTDSFPRSSVQTGGNGRQVQLWGAGAVSSGGAVAGAAATPGARSVVRREAGRRASPGRPGAVGGAWRWRAGLRSSDPPLGCEGRGLPGFSLAGGAFSAEPLATSPLSPTPRRRPAGSTGARLHVEARVRRRAVAGPDSPCR